MVLCAYISSAVASLVIKVRPSKYALNIAEVKSTIASGAPASLLAAFTARPNIYSDLKSMAPF